MDRLSDAAIEIVNELHRERLDYNSEYVPLINALNRLAAYEDTGLTPDEVDQIRRAAQTMMFPTVADFVRYAIQNFEDLQKYRKAESEGRLLVLPCKVGDTVYLRDLTPCKVVGINIGYYTRTVTIEFNDGGRIPNWQPRGFDEFGVSVFTTREAAEAARK